MRERQLDEIRVRQHALDDALARAGEEGHHDIVERQVRLAHERPERVGAAQPPQAALDPAGGAPIFDPNGSYQTQQELSHAHRSRLGE